MMGYKICPMEKCGYLSLNCFCYPLLSGVMYTFRGNSSVIFISAALPNRSQLIKENRYDSPGANIFV